MLGYMGVGLASNYQYIPFYKFQVTSIPWISPGYPLIAWSIGAAVSLTGTYRHTLLGFECASGFALPVTSQNRRFTERPAPSFTDSR